MKRFLILLAALSLVAMVGCSGDKAAEDAAPDATADVAANAEKKADAAKASSTDAEASHFMEVGCANCTFGMDGVEGCQAAVKVNDEPVLLTGVPVDAHGLGLCQNPKKAHIHGSMVEGKYVASEVKFE
jgi:hypothetical protein